MANLAYKKLLAICGSVALIIVFVYLTQRSSDIDSGNSVNVSTSDEYRAYEAKKLKEIDAIGEPQIEESEFLKQSITAMKSYKEEIEEKYTEISENYSYNDWDEWTPWVKEWDEKVVYITYTMKKYDSENYKDVKWSIDLASLALLGISSEYSKNVTNLQFKFETEPIDSNLIDQFQSNIQKAESLLIE